MWHEVFAEEIGNGIYTDVAEQEVENSKIQEILIQTTPPPSKSFRNFPYNITCHDEDNAAHDIDE